ncbi:Ornithine cyclodeaminase [Candidatus Burkholderia humilis]|nr:Ornithine cyclodeaminase [Candidatus Burkholderia humilis]
MNLSRQTTFDSSQTAALLDYAKLVDTLRTTVADYTAGRIVSPERLVVPIQDGGVMLSMPANADDLAIHKLVTVCPANAQRDLPTIHGQVLACDAHTGEMRFVLDGPTVTGRRTAAVTALGIQTLHGVSPREMAVIGTGKQAANHIEALATLFPDDATLFVKGRTEAGTQRFIEQMRPVAPNMTALNDLHDSIDIVVMVTTSRAAIYNEAGKKGRLIVGVGAFTPEMAEIGKQTIDSSVIVVDDPAGAKHEAGDLIQAGIDWTTVRSLADAIDGRLDTEQPIVFKSVGCAAWDLAACRVVRDALL